MSEPEMGWLLEPNRGWLLYRINELLKDMKDYELSNVIQVLTPVKPWLSLNPTSIGAEMILRCGNCHTEIAVVEGGVPIDETMKHVRYCIVCGRKVDWGEL